MLQRLLAWLRSGATPASTPEAAGADVGVAHLLLLLLPALERQGFGLSTDRYLRLQRLLTAIPDQPSLDEWRALLGPVLAADERQQDLFNAEWARCSDLLIARESDSLPPAKELAEMRPLRPNSPPLPPEHPKSSPTRRTAAGPQPLTVDLEESTEPPFVWRIEADEPVDLEPDADFGRTLTRLRARETAAGQDLDWPATVAATVREAGMPQLRYRSRTRPVEYLLLVERLATEDHRALLFDHLWRTLRDQEVQVARFFHDGDLRLCYNEQHPAGLRLQDLRHRYADARLLVLSNGYRLLNPRHGRPADWTTVLPDWSARALLTPVPRAQWGAREQRLADLLLLLPAAWDSLSYAAEQTDLSPGARYAELPAYVRAAAEQSPVVLDATLVRSLHRHFAPELCAWVAACAVWPALHFDLTLQIGRLLGTPEAPLTTLRHLTQLSRLEWFVQGHIPRAARSELLEFLEAQHPDLLQRTARYLLDLLERSSPDPDAAPSAAATERALHIALLQVLAQPDPDPAAVAQLRTVLKRLGGPAGLADFVLPPQLSARLEGYLEPEATDEPTGTKPLKVFISYTDADAPLYEQLLKHLGALVRKGKIMIWGDKIPFSGRFQQRVEQTISDADLALLLIGTDYTASNFINEVELPRLLEREKMGLCRLVPILLNAVSFYPSSLTHLEFLPKDHETGQILPVQSWPDPDQAFAAIVERLTEMLDEPTQRPTFPLPEMLYVPGGTFQMGSNDGQGDEKPVHEVQLDDFFLARTPVTNAQYFAFCDATGSHYPEWAEPGNEYHLKTGSNRHYRREGIGRQYPDHPVVGVSWHDAVAYCQWLSQQTGQRYRLPTEAEWEYTARGGPHWRDGYRYAGSNDLDEVGWYDKNSGGGPQAVAQKKPNQLGLYDLSGNVWEWCHDRYANYSGNKEKNPQGPEKGGYRVHRGGSWNFHRDRCRAAYRFYRGPGARFSFCGFRPCLQSVSRPPAGH